MTDINVINKLTRAEREPLFFRCCGSRRWAATMAERAPFLDAQALFDEAEAIWNGLNASEWLEAFSHHPQIGSDIESLRKKFSATAAWSEGEQSGVQEASESVLQRLAAGNKRYLEKFGYIFIVCATGKSAAEMVEMLEKRLGNDPQRELSIAAVEQAKITRIRLEKL